MSRAEVAQLYTVAGFPIVNSQPVNRCGTPAKPRITFVDISGDKNPEALVIDADPTCYAPTGRYFAVLVKEGVAWRSIVSGNRSIQALSTKTTRWLDMRVSDAGCTREFRYDGRNYSPTTSCARDAVALAPGTPKSASPQLQPKAPLSTSSPNAAASQEAETTKTLNAADQAAAFKAAGFKKQGSAWRNCDDRSASGSIERVGDFNGDGFPTPFSWKEAGLLRDDRPSILARQQARRWKLEANDRRPRHCGVPQNEGCGRLAGCEHWRAGILLSHRALERKGIQAPAARVRGEALQATLRVRLDPKSKAATGATDVLRKEKRGSPRSAFPYSTWHHDALVG